MTVLYFIDEVTEENGPLEVVPASHKVELHELSHNFNDTTSMTQHRHVAINHSRHDRHFANSFNQW